MSTDILALINALIDNERVYDTFEMQLYEGTGTAPAGYTEYVTRFNQLVRALCERSEEATPVVEKLLSAPARGTAERALLMLRSALRERHWG